VLGLKERASVTANMFRPKEKEVTWGRKKYTLRTFIVCTLSTTLGRMKSERRDGPDMFQACGCDKNVKVFHTISRGEPMGSCRGDMNIEVELNLLKPNDIYIYIYMSYRSANLQTLHFKYLFNKYTY